MDYEKAYKDFGFVPNQHAVAPNGNRQGMEAQFQIFSLLKHVPEKLVTSTSAVSSKQATA